MSDHCDFCFEPDAEWRWGVWTCAHCEHLLCTKVKFVEDQLREIRRGNERKITHLKVVVNGETIHEYRDES